MLAEIGVKPEKIRIVEGPSCSAVERGLRDGRRLSRIESLTPSFTASGIRALIVLQIIGWKRTNSCGQCEREEADTGANHEGTRELKVRHKRHRCPRVSAPALGGACASRVRNPQHRGHARHHGRGRLREPHPGADWGCWPG